MSLSTLIEQKRKAKIRQAQKKTAKTLVAGVTVGAIAGAVSGVLLAPKSGKETIKDIKGTAKDVNDKVRAHATKATANCKNNILDAKSKIKDYLNNKNQATEVESTLPNEKEVEEVVDEKVESVEENK
ncbi:YtxH domain-containing protein [Clostridium sardiniense]|uniref:YtxH domain-containing protein n=1 Tax=Clostridium sardiniense TaxID=29369 RepID=UPI001959BA4D|nr:YtxH domain-containing protein [Clostridium sardiniense]MBM7833730.1 gas vesicle protein [Clostridium sardiniense]